MPIEDPEIVRRDAVVLERDSEKKPRTDEERFGGAAKASVAGGDSGGELGPPRCSFSLAIALGQSVHGCLCDSPR